MVLDLRSTLSDQQRLLDEALRSGSDTAPIRASIAETENTILQEELASAQRANQRSLQTLERAEAERAVTDQIANDRLNALSASLAPLIASINHPQETNMAPTDHPEYSKAVAAKATADLALADTLKVASQRDVDVAVLTGRIDDVRGHHSTIATRRAHGDVRVADAGEVALLDMDLARLLELHASASLASQNARQRVRACRDEVAATAQWIDTLERLFLVDELLHHLARLESVAAKVSLRLDDELAFLSGDAATGAMSTLAGQAHGIGARLLRTAEQIDALSNAAGRVGTPIWGPSPPLLLKMRQLASARGEL